MYGENAPPSWARLPGARCRAVEHLTKLDGLKEFELFEGLDSSFSKGWKRDSSRISR
jgi:CRP/FNR family transcriptional regulator, cyclic AMP receptor protein